MEVAARNVANNTSVKPEKFARWLSRISNGTKAAPLVVFEPNLLETLIQDQDRLHTLLPLSDILETTTALELIFSPQFSWLEKNIYFQVVTSKRVLAENLMRSPHGTVVWEKTQGGYAAVGRHRRKVFALLAEATELLKRSDIRVAAATLNEAINEAHTGHGDVSPQFVLRIDDSVPNRDQSAAFWLCGRTFL